MRIGTESERNVRGEQLKPHTSGMFAREAIDVDKIYAL
jgi:hypothetical protein